LPGKRFELLHSGLRDGMTPVAFHEKCDGKGPTLVLVAGKSRNHPISVFGGFASVSWESRQYAGDDWQENFIPAEESFVFTVMNPFGDGIVRFPVHRGGTASDQVLDCGVRHGPSFMMDVCLLYTTVTKKRRMSEGQAPAAAILLFIISEHFVIHWIVVAQLSPATWFLIRWKYKCGESCKFRKISQE
jgi:hypothetical protein